MSDYKTTVVNGEKILSKVVITPDQSVDIEKIIADAFSNDGPNITASGKGTNVTGILVLQRPDKT